MFSRSFCGSKRNDFWSAHRNITCLIWPAAASIMTLLVSIILCSRRDLWTDELLTLQSLRLSFLNGLLQTFDYSAPLYQWILRILVHDNLPSPWLLRAPALFFSFMCPLTLWWFASRLFNNTTANISILFLVLNPTFLRYAGEARPYSLFVLLSIASMGAFYLLSTKVYNRCTYFTYILITVLLIYSHYYAFLLVAAQITFAAFHHKLHNPSRHTKTLYSALASVIIFSLPAVYLISRYIHTGLPSVRGWIPWANPKDIFWPWQAGNLVFGDQILSSVCVLTLFLILHRYFRYFPSYTNCRSIKVKQIFLQIWAENANSILCVIWIFFSFYVLLLISIFFMPLYHVRYVLPAMIPFSVLLSVTINHARKPVLALLLLFLTLIPLSHTLYDIRLDHRDFSNVINTLSKINRDHLPVYITTAGMDRDIKQNATAVGLLLYKYNLSEIKFMSIPDRLKHQNANCSGISKNMRMFILCFHGKEFIEGCLQTESRRYVLYKFGHLFLFDIQSSVNNG
jgi:hypothetical protein